MFCHLSKKKEEKKEGEIDEDVWDLLLSADKKDYERICAEHHITDFRGMLKKLQEMKREREEEQAQVHAYNLKNKSKGSLMPAKQIHLNQSWSP